MHACTLGLCSRLALILMVALGARAVDLRADASAQSSEKKYALEFRDKPWRVVLEWLSDQTDLPFVGKSQTGTFTFVPPRVGNEPKQYTIGEVIDILNEGLLAHGYMIVRRKGSLIVVPTGEKLDDQLVPRITLAELEKRGSSELVAVNAPLRKLKAADFAPEIKKLLGPTGDVHALSNDNSLLLMDTAGSVRRVLQIVRSIETEPTPTSQEKKTTFQMQSVPWPRVLEWLSDHTALPVIATTKPTGTFTFITPKQGKETAAYTTSEIIDLINEGLLAQKYLLIRRTACLHLVPADEKIDPSLVPLVEVSELPNRGRTELVSVMLPLAAIGGADSAKDIHKLMGPFGVVVLLTQAKRVVLQDTAGNLQRICKIVGDSKQPSEQQPTTPKVAPKTEGKKNGVDQSAGRQEHSPLAFVRLTQISPARTGREAFLWDSLTNRTTRLRAATGFNTFRIKDETGEKVLLNGKVEMIETRDVYFRVDDKLFGIHVGENMKEALVMPLAPEAAKKLGLKTKP